MTGSSDALVPPPKRIAPTWETDKISGNHKCAALKKLVKSLGRRLGALFAKSKSKHRDSDRRDSVGLELRSPATAPREKQKPPKKRRSMAYYGGPIPVGYWPYPPWGLPPPPPWGPPPPSPWGLPPHPPWNLPAHAYPALSPPVPDPQQTPMPHPSLGPTRPPNEYAVPNAVDPRGYPYHAPDAPRLWPVVLPHIPSLSAQSLHEHERGAAAPAPPPPPLPSHPSPLPSYYYPASLPPTVASPAFIPPYTFAPWVHPGLAPLVYMPDFPPGTDVAPFVAPAKPGGAAEPTSNALAVQRAQQTTPTAAFPAFAAAPPARAKPKKKRRRDGKRRAPAPIPMRGVRFTPSTKDSD